MIVAVLLAAVLNGPVPPSFMPPKGWTQRRNLPAGGPDELWLSPGFGVSGNGENLGVTSHRLAAGASLSSEVRDAVEELSVDRIIVASHSEPTCEGRQPGWSIDARLPLPNGTAISQVYHLAIVGGRAYTFVFTHKAGDPIEPAIANAFQSICP